MSAASLLQTSKERDAAVIARQLAIIQRNDLIAAARAALDWFGHDGESAIESFERNADDFHRATGFLRPGKSEPAECGDRNAEREAAWIIWRDAKNRKVRADLAAALKKAGAL